MKEIVEPAKCCGCSACASACPKQCIAMTPDADGFQRPVIDQSVCIDCGLCQRVCPAIEAFPANEPATALGVKNRNEAVRAASTSGGIFTLLATKVIEQGGVVFGVVFDQTLTAHHTYTESVEGLEAMRKSKYVESRTGTSFADARAFLRQGRPVLISGTPCQIAGLRKFLGREYDGLLTLAVVCHGVPSPMVWQKYLATLPARPTEVNFRVKSRSWKKFTTSFDTSVSGFKDPYMNMFLADLCLRPSCYRCPAKGGRSGADITIGDFWGIDSIDPAFDDDRGTSLVIVHTPKGHQAIDAIASQTETKSYLYSSATECNTAVSRSVRKPYYRSLFMLLCRRAGFSTAFRTITSRALPVRLFRRLAASLPL